MTPLLPSNRYQFNTAQFSRFTFYSCWAFGILILTFVASCKKNEGLNYKLEGVVSNARSGQKLSGVSLEVTQQLISGGTFNTNFVHAAHGVSDPNGAYSLEWPREAAAEFKLIAEENNYFDRTYFINPDMMVSGEPFNRNVALYPVATIEMHLVNELPSASDDVLIFRYDDTFFDCECCTEDPITLNGANVDTTFSCQLYGDQWLKFVKNLSTNIADTIMVDSVWCPAFQTTSVTVGY